MSAAQDHGGSAFPLACPSDFQFAEPGMSLRDWFAGQALAGILGGGFADTIPHSEACGEAAAFAYDYANAMIAERNRR